MNYLILFLVTATLITETNLIFAKDNLSGNLHKSTTPSMCDKGHFSVLPGNKHLTISSFKGHLCEIRVIGEWAYKNCLEDSFKESKCYKRYVNKFRPKSEDRVKTSYTIDSPQDLSDFVAFMSDSGEITTQEKIIWGLYKVWLPKPKFNQTKYSEITVGLKKTDQPTASNPKEVTSDISSNQKIREKHLKMESAKDEDEDEDEEDNDAFLDDESDMSSTGW